MHTSSDLVEDTTETPVMLAMMEESCFAVINAQHPFTYNASEQTSVWTKLYGEADITPASVLI